MTTLEADMYAVLQETLRTYVGNRAGRDNIVRVLRRADDEALEAKEQVTAEQARISPETRERLLLDSLQRDVIDGVPSPF